MLRNGKGPTVLLRTDMDALPIAEETGLSFASLSSLRAILERRSQLCMLAVTISTCPVGSAPPN